MMMMMIGVLALAAFVFKLVVAGFGYLFVY